MGSEVDKLQICADLRSGGKMYLFKMWRENADK